MLALTLQCQTWFALRTSPKEVLFVHELLATVLFMSPHPPLVPITKTWDICLSCVVKLCHKVWLIVSRPSLAPPLPLNMLFLYIS